MWLINYTGRRGGGPLDAIMMAKGLLQNNISLAAIISGQIENLPEWKKLPLKKLVVIDTYNTRMELITNTLFFKRKYKKNIFEQLGQADINVVYCPMLTFWTQQINSLFKGSEIIEVFHDPIPHSGEKIIIREMNENAIKRADKVIVHSKIFVDYVREKYNKETFYLPLGRQNIYSGYSNKTKVVNYPDNKINFLFFGTLCPYKGLNILGEAYKELYQEYTDKITLTIIGNGDFTPYGKSYKGLANFTLINRWIKDEEVESIFIGSNLICVCPYLDATQSGAVLLAQEYNVPLIATKTGGIEEQIIDGDTGLLVRPNDVKDLKRAMKCMIDNISLRDHISACQKEELRKLDWDVLAGRLIEIANNNG